MSTGLKINHPFVSPKADGADATLVQPSNWNADHSIAVQPPLKFGTGTTEQLVPASYTPPGNGTHQFILLDGDDATPQTEANNNPTFLVQRTNNASNGIAIANIFHVINKENVNVDYGSIPLTICLSDASIARGGSVVRKVAAAQRSAAAAALTSATISGSDIIIITATPHRAYVNNAVKIAGSAGITGLNAQWTVTQVDSPTQLRIAKGALTGGPAAGGSVIVPTGFFADWHTILKDVGVTNVRMVGCESDMLNYSGDAGPDLSSVDATYNFAIYSNGNHCTTAVYIESGDNTAKYYYPLKFGPNAVVTGYPYIDTTANNNTYSADFARIGNSQAIKWADVGGGLWPILFVDGSNNTRFSAPLNQYIHIGPNLTDVLIVGTNKISNQKAVTDTQIGNYIASETGVDYAIIVTLNNAEGVAVPLAAGLEIVVKLSHALRAGVNTCSFNGTVLNVKSSRNPANNIGVAYVSGGIIKLLYDGTQLLDMSQ